MNLFLKSDYSIHYFSEENYAIYSYNLEAPLSPYSSFPSPDSLAYPTPDTLAPSPSSSCTAYSRDSPEPTTKRSPPLKCSRKYPSKRHDPTHIPRPRNAFIVFRSAFSLEQQKAGTSKQQQLSKHAAFVWNKMTDAEKFPYQETARLEKMLHQIEYPDYQYSPSPKGTRTRKPTLVPVPSQSVSLPGLPLPVLPESAEFTFSQHCIEGAQVAQPNFLINALPPCLEFGTNTLLFADASGSGALEPLSGQIGYYPQTQFPLAEQCNLNAPEAVSPVAFDYALQNYEFDPNYEFNPDCEFNLDDYLLNQLLRFN